MAWKRRHPRRTTSLVWIGGREDADLHQRSDSSFASLYNGRSCEGEGSFQYLDSGADLACQDLDGLLRAFEKEGSGCVGVVGALLCVAGAAGGALVYDWF